jgi:hypothetical protein
MITRTVVDRFDALVDQPIAWQETAVSYIVAANVLFELDVADTPAGFTWSDSGSNRPILLLYATAAENLLKAVRIAQGKPVVVNGRLAKYYSSHDLLRYADDAKLVLGRPARSMLVRLQHVLEAGKYPVAKVRGGSSRAWRYEHPSDAERICCLLQTLDTALRATGTRCLPPFEVAKLHSPGSERRRRTRG